MCKRSMYTDVCHKGRKNHIKKKNFFNINKCVFNDKHMHINIDINNTCK